VPGPRRLDPAGERIYQGTAAFLCEAGKDGRVDLEMLEEAVMKGNYLLSTSRKSTKARTSSLSEEVHGAVAAFDHGRYCTLLLDFFEGREVSPRLVWPKLSLPAYRQDVVPVMKLVQYCDCDSLIKHLLAENTGLLQDRRFLGYVKILEDALTSGEIAKLFHVASRHNMSDFLTKVMTSMALVFWRKTGSLRVEPGEYGARAEARRAERRARSLADRREHERDAALSMEA